MKSTLKKILSYKDISKITGKNIKETKKIEKTTN